MHNHLPIVSHTHICTHAHTKCVKSDLKVLGILKKKSRSICMLSVCKIYQNSFFLSYFSWFYFCLLPMFALRPIFKKYFIRLFSLTTKSSSSSLARLPACWQLAASQIIYISPFLYQMYGFLCFVRDIALHLQARVCPAFVSFNSPW